MLVFTRKPDQSIMIGSDIEVVVLGFTREGVKIGIHAPREVSIHRREVFDAIVLENRAAMQAVANRLQSAAELLKDRVPQEKKKTGR